MKLVLALVSLIVVITSCSALSRLEYTTFEVDEASVNRGRASCGNYSTEIMRFGRGNSAVVRADGAEIELCSEPHMYRIVAGGLLVMVLGPRGTEPTQVPGQVRVTHAGLAGELRVWGFIDADGEHVPAPICPIGEFHCSQSEIQPDIPSEGLALLPGQQVWMEVPDSANLRIQLDTPGAELILRAVRTRAYGLWFLTV